MTRKHFIALAEALRSVRPKYKPGWELAQFNADVEAVANACAASCLNFKRQRFLNYVNGLCGPNGGRK